MGAVAWYETGPYDADFGTALRVAQESKLRNGGYGAESVDELWLDADRLEHATLRPMPAAETRTLLGIWRRPTPDRLPGNHGGLKGPALRGTIRDRLPVGRAHRGAWHHEPGDRPCTRRL